MPRGAVPGRRTAVDTHRAGTCFRAACVASCLWHRGAWPRERRQSYCSIRPPVSVQLQHCPRLSGRVPAGRQLCNARGELCAELPSRKPCQIASHRARRDILLALAGGAVASPSAPAWAKRAWRRGDEVLSLDQRRVVIADAITNSGVSNALVDPPTAWPFTSDDFWRWDEEYDAKGFVNPSFERQIDYAARMAIERLNVDLLQGAPSGLSVLDLCASWDSHLPASLNASRIALVGMNRQELETNTVATEIHICDLNRDTRLPFGDAEFDAVTLTLGIQYMTRPRELFTEIHRVLRSGGLAVVSFSSLSFPWKVVKVWGNSMHDGAAQCRTVGTYFRFSPAGGWHDIAPLDLSPHKSSLAGSDPLWAVVALKA
ncbi:unnamed protein product [Polarella glacialis]|uniref:Methyltransferase type 11 domain-containing protein n=1 Tax=Polarella glacialis TaxID=89957 RepID=A0A813K6M3_POLGL|nr:unnamed protein product [Polarella glacialis]CAE8693931.1 unnamed protein product [Polarella glacialis]